ncbi:MAG TPA: hypothetical protein VMT46_17160 [Anaerolineaceae bacterium]|nr:hypothetical protein [Anaerolineaceae bacterium]
MDIQSKTVVSGLAPNQRTVILDVGKVYLVSPINERDMQNRGRTCILLEFVPYSYDKPEDILALVKFTDTNRQGRVELEDLVPVS